MGTSYSTGLAIGYEIPASYFYSESERVVRSCQHDNQTGAFCSVCGLGIRSTAYITHTPKLGVLRQFHEFVACANEDEAEDLLRDSGEIAAWPNGVSLCSFRGDDERYFVAGVFLSVLSNPRYAETGPRVFPFKGIDQGTLEAALREMNVPFVPGTFGVHVVTMAG